MALTVQTRSPFDQAFADGKTTPVLTNILVFADAENNATVGEVSRAFRRALEAIKGRVCAQLMMPQNVDANASQDNDAPARLAVTYNTTVLQHILWLRTTPMAEFIFGLERPQSLQVTTEQVRDAILGEQNPAFKNMRSARLCVELERWGRERQTAIDFVNARGVVEAAHDPENPMPALYRSLQRILVKENVMECFRNATRPLDPQDPSYHSHRLQAYHARQREIVNLTPEHRRVFTQLPPHSFSPERFFQAEEIGTGAELERDAALLQIVHQIEYNVRGRLQPGEAAPAFPRTPAEWRLWFHNEQNNPHIDELLDIAFNGSQALPSELWRCRSLQSLGLWGGGPENQRTELPRQIENLRGLTELELIGNRFEQIPEVVERLPNLRYLGLRNNQIRELPPFLINMRNLSRLDVVGNPIRVLPDEIYRHLGDGLSIDRHTLTEIPFRLWFKERFALSSPQLDWGGFEYALYALIALPLFVYNSILMGIVERVVTAIRDKLDYDRMVEVDPHAAPPQNQDALRLREAIEGVVRADGE